MSKIARTHTLSVDVDARITATAAGLGVSRSLVVEQLLRRAFGMPALTITPLRQAR